MRLGFRDLRVPSVFAVLCRSYGICRRRVLVQTWLRKRFAKTPITVVYIPAPLAIYQKAGSTIIFHIEPPEAGLTASTTPQAIDRRSSQLCTLVRDSALRNDMAFLDTQPALRAAAAEKLIHGPVDWDHPNELGYRTLAATRADRVTGPAEVGTCQ